MTTGEQTPILCVLASTAGSAEREAILAASGLPRPLASELLSLRPRRDSWLC